MTAAPQTTSPRESRHRARQKDPLLGQVVGGYHVLERIGAGVTAVVYRAVDRSRDRTVALKVLRPEFACGEGHVRSFRREASLVARLDDEGIVEIHGSGQDGIRPWMAMEYVSGGTLRDLVRSGARLSARRLTEVALEIARVLANLAEAGIVHRDLKPANVLFTRDGHVKLTDFGIALDKTSSDPAGTYGIGAGTRRYMAPEQAESVEIDERADLYSLGATLFFAMTGSPPPAAEPSSTSIADLDFGPARSHPLALLVRRLLAPRPEDRSISARELVAILEMRHFTPTRPRSAAA